MDENKQGEVSLFFFVCVCVFFAFPFSFFAFRGEVEHQIPNVNLLF